MDYLTVGGEIEKNTRPVSDIIQRHNSFVCKEEMLKRYSTGSINGNVHVSREGKKNSELSSQKLLPFRVYMEYPPAELNNYDFINNELGTVKQRANDEFDLHFNTEMMPADMIMFHKCKEDVSSYCLKYFDSIPEVHEMQWSEMNSRTSPTHQGKNNYNVSSEIEKLPWRGVMVCIVDETIDQKMYPGYLEPIRKNLRDHDHIIFVFGPRDAVKDKKCLAKSLGRWILSSIEVREQNVWHIDELEAITTIYQAFYDHLNDSIDLVLRKLESPDAKEKFTDELQGMKNRVLQLKEECYFSFVKDAKSIPEDLQEILVKMSREGVHAYTMHNDTLRIIVEREHLNRVKLQYQDKIGKYTKVHFVPFDDHKVSITPHHKPGEQLYIDKHDNKRYGTLGIYGQLESTRDIVAVTGAHVITKDMSAFVSPEEDANGHIIELGPCIYSPRHDQPYQINVTDIAVIRVKNSILEVIEREFHHVNVEVFNGSRSTLLRQRVFKIGATSKHTQGFINNPDLNVMIGGRMINLILVNGIGQNKFSEPGDSGSIVFMKRGEKYIAIAVVFGSELTLDEIDPNLAVVVRLDDALKKFNHDSCENLKINRF